MEENSYKSQWKKKCVYKSLEKQEKQTECTNNLCQTFVSFSFWCAVLQIDDSSSFNWNFQFEPFFYENG